MTRVVESPYSEGIHVRVDAAAATHVGRVRALNEDSYLLSDGLAIVADGMGGHAAGDVASRLTVEVFEQIREQSRHGIIDAAHVANRRIRAEAVAHPDKLGMGTTLTGVALVHEGGVPHWFVFNIGDSRTYRFADGRLVQVSVDHAEVEELIAAGRISREEARRHPLRNVITRALGTEPAEPDTWLLPVSGRESFLLCSDGLTNEIAEDLMETIMAAADSAESAAQRLVSAAVEAGGRDNVTVIVLRSDAERGDEVETATFPRTELGTAG